MNADIHFLKELQTELNEQSNDHQASPRFWVVGDYRMVGCPDGCQDAYEIGIPDEGHYGPLDDFMQELSEMLNDPDYEFSKEAREGFDTDIGADEAIEWIKEHYNETAYLIPVREEHFVRENTMFLTKAEAQAHIKSNHYHYTDKAHTYAMTAWRAPKVERLLKILGAFDWDSINAN